MAQYVAVRNGGKTDENGAYRFLRQLSSNGQGPAQASHMQVTQHATPNGSVDIQVGDLAIAYQDYAYYTWIDAIYNLAITANSSGNNRIDAIVAYVDLSVVSSASNNNPGALKFMDVTGTPAGSPVAPNSSAIQSAVGAGNPYYVLAYVAANNGFSNIVTANITDNRTQYILGSNAKYLFFVPGAQAVANDVSINPLVPAAQTVTTLSAYAKTAPTGSKATIRIYNITQALEVAEVDISAGSHYGTTTTMQHGALQAGDILQADITNQGSGGNAANITAILF